MLNLIIKREFQMNRCGVWLIISLFSIALLMGGCKEKSAQETFSPKTPVVSVSTFPLYEAASAVAHKSLDLQLIIPLGSDPHLFSPDPKQVVNISKSALFIYNGADFENWAEPLKNTLPAATKVVDMSRYVSLMTAAGQEHHDEEHDGHAHHHGGNDPHYWLDIDNMIKMVTAMQKEFSGLSPADAKQFSDNADRYIAELEKLKTEYTQGLKECRHRTIITNHNAFGYLASAYNLENISVVGLSSDEQPSAKTIAKVIELVKTHGIKTIFFEALINNNISQTIAKETGATAVSLQPLGNISEDELKSGATYLSIMRHNLSKLKDALECR
jgi:zinc transport system substrate-binding protein